MILGGKSRSIAPVVAANTFGELAYKKSSPRIFLSEDRSGGGVNGEKSKMRPATLDSIAEKH